MSKIVEYPIIILPGWRLSHKLYINFENIFKKNNFKVYTIKFPGFNDGPILHKIFNLTDYVIFLKKFLKQNKINEAIFIAHSFGGRVALKMLCQEPKMAKALILSGTPGFLTIGKIKLMLFIKLAKIGGLVFSLPLISKTKNYIRKIYYKLIGAHNYYHTEGIIRETFKNVIKEPLLQYMQQIRLPILLLWGNQDKTVPVKIARKMHKIIKNSKLTIVPNQKHMILIDDPENSANIILKFLDNI